MTTPAGNIEQEGFVLEWRVRPPVPFRALDFNAVRASDGRPFSGYLKWDGCTNVWQGPEEDYTHCCTLPELTRIVGPDLGKALYKLGAQHLEGWE